MPDFHEIVQNIQQIKPAWDMVRDKALDDLYTLTGRNTVLYYSAWLHKPNNVSTTINDFDMNGFMSVLYELDKTKGLDLFLHTPGGDLAATEAIGKYLKKQFNNDIRVIVPHLAMSGGTLLAFAAHTIVMGNHSSLGPIDPILGGMPAHGVCEEFEKVKEEVSKNPAIIEVWRHIINKYTPSFIGECQKAVNWSNEIAENWLMEGMFAEYKNKSDVKKIVDGFGNHGTTKSHSRHFMIDQCRELGLNVVQLSDDDKLQDAVLSVHHACIYTLGIKPIVKLIENHLGKVYASRVNSDE